MATAPEISTVAHDPRDQAGSVRTVGVEEELLLVDTRTRLVVPRARAVLHHVERDDMEKELFRHQLELQTTPVKDVGEIAAQLSDLRRRAASAADEVGLALMASGTAPGKVQLEVSDDDRYAAMVDQYGEIARGGGTCGLHVHVGVDSDEEGVAVIDAISPWLSLLIALSANSPFTEERDTSHASWRTIQWGRLPTAGPTAPFGSVGAYRSACRALVETGVARDERMLYFDARLSHSFPTVEVRVADAVTDPHDAALIAALARALVETAGRDHQAGHLPLAPPRPELVVAGRWQAARYGMTNRLLDPRTHRPQPAGEVIQALLDHVHDALEDAGDLALVHDGVARVRSAGAATRQRAALERTGSIAGVVDDLIERTASPS